MLAEEQRDKQINAIVYFARHTNNLGLTKLCKLLYFLDFEHYAVTGRSVTGLEYSAWDKGPVPIAIYKEIKKAVKGSPSPDLDAKVEINPKAIAGGRTFIGITAKAKFDPSEFTKRELDLLEDIAKRFKKALADKMVDETHLERKPWHQIYEVEGKVYQSIPYELAVREEDRELIDELANEFKEVVDNFDL